MYVTTLSRAIDLAKQGIAVFPCNKRKQPLTEHGHLDATTDIEAVATMFGEFPDAHIGVHAERSGIVVLDIDTHDNTDKNGFESLELSWLGVPDSWGYDTPTGGKHIWYTAPQHLNLPPKPDYRGMLGVDRKSGSSYVIVYATDIPDVIELTVAPEWLCDAREARSTGDAFEGDLDEWLNALEPGEEPGNRVLGAIERIPDEDFGHPVMVERQFEFIRLAAEGAPGVRVGLDLLRDAWLRPPYDTEDLAYEFDSALATGIKRYGAQVGRIAGLPSYLSTLDLIGSSATERLMGAPKDKRQYYSTIEMLARYNLTDDQIATLLWNGPAVKHLAHDWGIDYLYATIAQARVKGNAPIENPAQGLNSPNASSETLPLLDVDERIKAASQYTFIEQYLNWCATKVNVLNGPYHRQNALTTLSLIYGGHVFIPLKSRPMGVNLFQIGLGGSSTGKSESISMRDQILKIYYGEDPEYNVGSSPSPEALQQALLNRDAKVSFFNTDEAAAPLNEFLYKSYQAGMIDRLTSYYEGYVPPMLRMGNKDSGKTSAITSFNIGMFGTPDKVIGLLTREQFESGFLARFCWTLSAAVVEDDTQYAEQQALEKHVTEEDSTALGLAETLALAQGLLGERVPMLTNNVVLERLTKNRKAMDVGVKPHEQYDILQPSIRRLGDNIRKIATLLAVADGSSMVYERHALKALEIGEELFHNVQKVASRVSASEFQRNCDSIEEWILSQGGELSSAKVFHKFRKYELREVMAFIEALVQQGRIRRFEATKERGEWFKINDGEENLSGRD